MGVKWRDQEDAYSRLAREEREEPLLFFRGVAIALAVSVPVWVGVWLLFRG